MGVGSEITPGTIRHWQHGIADWGNEVHGGRIQGGRTARNQSGAVYFGLSVARNGLCFWQLHTSIKP
jgi:hypothetical protein